MKNLAIIISAAALTLLSGSCRRSDAWTVKGDIAGAAGKTILLEGTSNGRWYLLDSASVSNNGAFGFEQPAAMFPGIYRVTVDGQSAYFPIDSIDMVTLTGDIENLGANYTIAGTPGAENMNKANALIAKLGNAANDEDTKRKLSELVLEDPAGITAYYIVSSRTAGGKPVFDPANRTDLRIIGAVANAYTERRSNDPRTSYLRNLYLSNRAASTSVTEPLNLEVTAISYPEIELLDENGKPVKLSEVAAKGPTIVSFTRYTADYSPILNVEMAKLKDRGYNIYQIGFDGDEYQWRQSAKNLPWTTVYNSPKDGETNVRNYNVGIIPTTFVINSAGELVDRVTGFENLAEAIK